MVGHENGAPILSREEKKKGKVNVCCPLLTIIEGSLQMIQTSYYTIIISLLLLIDECIGNILHYKQSISMCSCVRVFMSALQVDSN